MKKSEIVLWRGFKCFVLTVYKDTVKIAITSTWHPVVPKSEVKKYKTRIKGA